MSEVADTAAPVETAPTTETAAPTSAPEVTTEAPKAEVEKPAPTMDEELSAIWRKANPERGSDGKFAPKPGEIAKSDENAEPAKTSVEIPQMPASWAKANEEVWKALPPAARDLVLKREADGEKGVAALKAQYEPYKGLEEALKPHKALLSSMGLNEVQGVQRLLTFHQSMMADKHRGILEVAQAYGVDLPRMFGPQGQRPGQNSTVDQLYSKINRLEAIIAADKQAQVETTTKDLTGQIEKFSKAEGREHFETLKPKMAQLLTSGLAESLEDAYDKAALLNPDIRSQIEAKAKSAAEEKVRAEAAKKAAAVNVKSSVANSNSPKQLDDELRSIYRKNRAT